MNLNDLIELFKWMTVINVSLLALSAVLLMGLKGVMVRTHGKLFGINEKDVSLAAYNFLGNFKLLIFVFNIVPFLSLHLIR